MTTTHCPIPQPFTRRAYRTSGLACLLLLLLISNLSQTPPLSAAAPQRPLAQSFPPANSLSKLDPATDVTVSSSLVLDGAGNPVISYGDASSVDLKVLHCNDVNCTGNDESIATPDSAGQVGGESSIVLDSAGNPVISYYEFIFDGVADNGNLKVMHCNDPNCAGNNESITSPDTVGDVGRASTIRLDAAGNPVIVYNSRTAAQSTFKVLHCNDPNCAGNNESITSHASSSFVERHSFVLDSAGRPVISYFHFPTLAMTVMHCNDVNCAGNNESVTRPDNLGSRSNAGSLILDAAGFPVIAYSGLDAGGIGRVKLMHCNDANCAGNNESIRNIADDQSFFSKHLVLDSSGNPTVAYTELSGRVALVRCSNPNCTSFSNNTPANPTIGTHLTLALDATSNPIVAFSENSLWLLHCGSPTCPAGPTYFVSLINGGTISGASRNTNIADEDITRFDPVTRNWELYFDGSDVISRTNDVDAFAFFPNNDIALSFNLTRTLSALGEVTPNDVVRFTPSTLGTITAGSFAWLLDGSDVGLDAANEDVDSIALDPTGRLVVSTRGSLSVPGLSGQDEDLIVLTNATWGANSVGTWNMYFDGSDVGLLDGSEDVKAAWINNNASQIYLTTQGLHSVPGLSGDGNDIFVCSVLSLGWSTGCTFTRFVDGDTVGLTGQPIDGIYIGDLPSAAVMAGSLADNDDDGVVIDEGHIDTGEDDGSTSDDTQQDQRVYLPIISQD